MPGLSSGSYKLLIRAVDPLPGRKPLVFANEGWDRNVAGWLSLGVFTVAGPTGVVGDANDAFPCRYELAQNFPNPCNPTTVLSLQVPVASDVKLSVFDLLGREVVVLVDGRRGPGRYAVTFDGSSLASGVYLYRLSAGAFTQTKSLVLLMRRAEAVAMRGAADEDRPPLVSSTLPARSAHFPCGSGAHWSCK